MKALATATIIITILSACHSQKKSKRAEAASYSRDSESPADSVNGSSDAQPASVPVGNPADKDLLALFSANCYSCHGQNGANAGNIGNILDLTALAEKKLLRRGDLQSKVYLRMIDSQQPMPPAGQLTDDKTNIVKKWIESGDDSKNRKPYSYADLVTKVYEDFRTQEDKANVRYFHLVNLYNSGAPSEHLELVRKALLKMLNMVSTSQDIRQIVHLDEERLVYRVNLKDFDLHRPETLYTYMLKNTFPDLSEKLRDKWLPDPEERKVENYYGARFKEIFEAKRSRSPFIDAGKHTFRYGLPRIRSGILEAMSTAMREAHQDKDQGDLPYGEITDEEKQRTRNCQSNPELSSAECSRPMPLMRADWFVSQVAGNMGMRLYYHLSGLDDDTVTLDAALGIDDVEGLIIDNDPKFDPMEWGKDPIIRAGFNNSGVSVNHRVIERVQLDYTPGRPLWRSYEFKSSRQSSERDIFKSPAGPFFEIGSDGEPGYECITLMTPPTTTVFANGEYVKVRTLSLLDHGLLYPSDLEKSAIPTVVSRLRNIKPSAFAGTIPPFLQQEHAELLAEFEGLYGHRDYDNYRSGEYLQRYGRFPERELPGVGMVEMQQCETPEYKTFRHESLEYLFLRRNGLQGFVNVGLFAQHLDYKVPNARALENPEALLIPAYDQPGLMVVGAPLSCLSCHANGYIEKEDMVADSLSMFNHPREVEEKIRAIHVPFDRFKGQMRKDNELFRSSLAKMNINGKDPEPIVHTYRRWAGAMTKAQVAAELSLTVPELDSYLTSSKTVRDLLSELTLEASTIKRSDFEFKYADIMCAIHESCVEWQPHYAIPAQ